MFTKFASFEDVEILDLKGSDSQVKTASLDKLSDFRDFRTDDGFLYARIRAISSRVNKNNDGWPSIELAGGQDVFDRHLANSKTAAFTASVDKEAKYGFSTFLGKPIFVDHNNSDPSRARGVIVDAKLHVEDPAKTASLDSYYSSADVDPLHKPPTWVELMLEVDAKSFPKFAQAIIDGGKDSNKGIDGFSMGANVERTECNICKNSATSPDEFCNHIRNKGALYDYIDPETGIKTAKRSYENCFGNQFFEISGVFDPADETALSREIISSVQKEGELSYVPEDRFEGAGNVACPTCDGTGYDKKTNGKCPMCTGVGSQTGSPVAPVGDGIASPQFLRSDDYTLPPLDRGTSPKKIGATMKMAGNPEPQSDLLHIPEEVDTLRQDRICEVCGSNMDSEKCDVCGWVEPPKGLDNPDLSKAKDNAEKVNEVDLEPEGLASNPPTTAHITSSDMSWKIEAPSRVAAETVVTPNKGPASDEPTEEVVSDPSSPVTSSVRTAADFIAAAGELQGENMERTADAASGAPEVATPDTNVDVDGVGGVMDASNESASAADTQTDVEGIGGTGEEAVEAESTVSVDQGDEHSKNIEAIPTKTFGDGKGKFKQTDPVSGKPFPASEDGVHASAVKKAAIERKSFRYIPEGDPEYSSMSEADMLGRQLGCAGEFDRAGIDRGISEGYELPEAYGSDTDSFLRDWERLQALRSRTSSWRIEALDSGAFPRTEDSPADGSAVKGTQPADAVGVADDRVDVLDTVTSPANNSGPTKTWSGTDGNGVTRQQDPTTNETLEGADGVKQAHIIDSMKLAEMEVDLGLLDKESKFNRVDELSKSSAEVVKTGLEYAERVKTAGLAKRTSKTASRFPSLARNASVETSTPAVEDAGDAGLFW